MKINKVTDLFYILLASAMLAIGRVYDSRLEVFDFNFSYFFSIPFILLSILFLSSKIKIYFNKLLSSLNAKNKDFIKIKIYSNI